MPAYLVALATACLAAGPEALDGFHVRGSEPHDISPEAFGHEVLYHPESPHIVFDADNIHCEEKSLEQMQQRVLHAAAVMRPRAAWTAQGETGLLKAVLKHLSTIMKANPKISIDQRNYKCGGKGITPLMMAASKGRPAAVRALVEELGADWTLTDDNGDTAEDIARYWAGLPVTKAKECAKAAEILREWRESRTQSGLKAAPPADLVKETAADKPKETPKEAPKDTPKDTPEDTPKDTPKEAPKEALKEVPKEQPKDASKETATVPAKEPVAEIRIIDTTKVNQTRVNTTQAKVNQTQSVPTPPLPGSGRGLGTNGRRIDTTDSSSTWGIRGPRMVPYVAGVRGGRMAGFEVETPTDLRMRAAPLPPSSRWRTN